MPVLPEVSGRSWGAVLMMLPMMLGGAVMMLFMVGRSNPTTGLMMAGMMGLMAVMMIGMQFGQGGGDRTARLAGERRDYLRYLGQMRRQVRSVATEQRTALAWRHPDPAGLWSVAMTGRLWERRGSHADFAEVRIGTGPQRLALTMKRNPDQ